MINMEFIIDLTKNALGCRVQRLYAKINGNQYFIDSIVSNDVHALAPMKKKLIRSEGKYYCFYNSLGSENPFLFLRQVNMQDYEISMLSEGHVKPWKAYLEGSTLEGIKFKFVFFDKPTFNQFKSQLESMSVEKINTI